jgi:hypothetical protein
MYTTSLWRRLKHGRVWLRFCGASRPSRGADRFESRKD